MMHETAGSKMKSLMLESAKTEASTEAVKQRIIKILTGEGYKHVRWAEDTYKHKSFSVDAFPQTVTVAASKLVMQSIHKILRSLGYGKMVGPQQGLSGAHELTIRV